jgi:enoyl-CoA hydratase/carnithine racemase
MAQPRYKTLAVTSSSPHFHVEEVGGADVLRLHSTDGMNRLSRDVVDSLRSVIDGLSEHRQPMIITGNQEFFSVGADLEEVRSLSGPEAYEFSMAGQALMNAIECFPAPVYAAVSGYCMGGGLDLALACHRRIALPNAVFGHRGAALGLVTGWGGTQRLPRLIGKARALQMFATAEKITAKDALEMGLINGISEDPVVAAINKLTAS